MAQIHHDRTNMSVINVAVMPKALETLALDEPSCVHFTGALSMKVNQSVYGLYFENGNLFGNTSLHNITIAMTQNGSRSVPSEAQFRGQLELSDSIQGGSASFQVDTRSLCINLSSTIIQEQAGLTGTLTHNVSTLYAAGIEQKYCPVFIMCYYFL